MAEGVDPWRKEWTRGRRSGPVAEGVDPWPQVCNLRKSGLRHGKLKTCRHGGEGHGKLQTCRHGGEGHGKLKTCRHGGEGHGKLKTCRHGGEGHGKLKTCRHEGEGHGPIKKPVISRSARAGFAGRTGFSEEAAFHGPKLTVGVGDGEQPLTRCGT